MDTTQAEEPPWKKVRLALERPYKDDDGKPIPELLDITPEGELIYEPREKHLQEVGENLRRIFIERGINFFEKRQNQLKASQEEHEGKDAAPHKVKAQVMTVGELFKMRTEIGQQLHIACGELSQARDVLSLLLESSEPVPRLTNSAAPPPNLAATVVTKPPAHASIRAFESQLITGGKDRALRNAVELFTSAGRQMDAGRTAGEKFWTDALKLRSGNWGLVPAPLPFGSATGKHADRTSKDFLVSFGLEDSPSPFRRRAIGRMSTLDDDQHTLEFPFRQRGRLMVSISLKNKQGHRLTYRSRLLPSREDALFQALHSARAEVVEQEIFSTLIRESGSLPTASARVSERLIVLEAAQSTELRFELVDDSSLQGEATDDEYCDLIYSLLHVLLLRVHAHMKTEHLALAGQKTTAIGPPPLLQPVIDMLQYRVFCERVHTELAKITAALSQAKIDATFDFEAVGNSGADILASFRCVAAAPMSGQALLRVDHRNTLRFTFVSPSSLTAHLPQATLPIHSIPQLCQLLTDEVRRCILSRICEAGTELSSYVQGTWFVDMLSGRSVGRWDGCATSFAVAFHDDFRIVTMGVRTHRVNSNSRTFTETYDPEKDSEVSLFHWARNIVSAALAHDSPSTDMAAPV